MKISRKTAVSLIHDTRDAGTIFGVTFIKKDGTERTMSARLGVRKGVKGIGLSYTPADYNLIGVFDMNNGFRMINVSGLRRLSIGGIEYEIIP